MKNAKLVYSTATGGNCPTCGWPLQRCACSTRSAADQPVPSRIVAKLRIEKKGRGGKTVTVVEGLPRNAVFLKELASALKRGCGVGGTVLDEGLELQGDLRGRVRDILLGQGMVVKG